MTASFCLMLGNLLKIDWSQFNQHTCFFSLGGGDELELLPFANCSSFQKYRFYCSKNDNNCGIGNNMPNCITNDHDELSYDDNILLKNMKCINRGSFERTRLHEYIAQLS